MAFNAVKSAAPDFDRRIGQGWARRWTSTIFDKWFGKGFVREIPREERLETLKMVFADGFGDFDALLKYATFSRRIAAAWVKMFMRHPRLRGMVEKMFAILYFPLLRRF